MRRLSVSLLLVVLLAVISAGWAIDRLFSHLDAGNNDTLNPARSIGLSLAAQLDTGELLGDRGDSIKILQYEELALPPSLQKELESGIPLTLESANGISLIFDMPKTQKVLTLDLPPQGNNETSVRLMLTVLFYTAIILLILIWLYPLIRRLQRLAATAKLFGEGELHKRVPTHPRSHLHDIESEFNNMARRIEGLVSDNKLLSSAVSHDLRTPLARLRFGVDALSETVVSEDQANYLHRLSSDLTAMEQLVSVLLEFARMDKEILDLPLHVVNLHTLIEQAVIVARDSSDMNVEFRIDTDPDDSTIVANERYASMMINNVLQNAIRYGRSSIIVTLSKERDRASLTVEDDGPGIPETERDDVWKPFVRNVGQQFTTRSSGRSYGLGLAIVSRIAEWHEAELFIDDSIELGGALVKLAYKSASHSRLL